MRRAAREAVHAAPGKAAAALWRALELRPKEPSPDSNTRFERSRALALLAGLGGEASSGVTTTEAAMFVDPAVASLRGRPDFQKLLPELEAKAGPKAKPED